MSNLLPKQEKQALVKLYRKRFVAVVLIFIACAAIMGSILILPAFFLAETTERALTEKLAMLNQQETSELQRSLGQSVGDINMKLGVFKENIKSSPLIADFIDPMLSVKSPSIHLTHFTYAVDATSGKVTMDISGTADTRQALTAFAERVRVLDGIAEVTVPITSFIKDQNVTFTLTAIRK